MTPLLRAAGSKCHGSLRTRNHHRNRGIKTVLRKQYKNEFKCTPASEHVLCLLQHGAHSTRIDNANFRYTH